ncbi:MAG: RAMP superfamily CRISPR-associated protein [Chloroflexota bacterium]
MTNPNEAHAPYNFIPLPDKVAKAETLPDHDCYDTTRKSGYFDVTLTTETPLYIRGLITQQEASQRDEHKNKPDFFQYGGKPVIPGSSLRGMLRNLVEIIAFGKIAQVSGKPKIFFRAVAADKNDPLGEDYKRMVGQLGANVRAGYLEKKAGEWYVRPAKPYQGGKTFAKVRDLDPSGSISKEAPTLPNLIHLNDRDYKVQYHNVVITEPPLDTRGGLRCSVRSLRSGEKRSGVLVCTGNMAESSTADSRGKVRTGRRNFTFVFEADLDSNVKLIQIAPQAVKDYLEGLTPFQTEKPPFEADSGCLVEGRPIFYVTPTKAMGGMIHYF